MQESFMKGLELSRAFYETYGAPMIEETFPQVSHLIAVGLAGSGSECFGYDDEWSQDHDFEPGFCIFLPSEDVVDRGTAFALERAYAKLPKTFMGFSRTPLSPVGGNRHGVIRIADFFCDKTGREDGCLSLRDWFSVPEQSLAEATNGLVFRDDYGLFSEMRGRLSYLPEDVRRKKLAGHLALMGQSGEYNYQRCMARGETEAASMAVGEFVKSALHAAFLLEKRYLPYYKWSFKALRELPTLSCLHQPLSRLLLLGGEKEKAKEKEELIAELCQMLSSAAREQGLSAFEGETMDGHARSVNDSIADPTVRNLHLLYGV
ncbi:MAG: DUF4037 domain-containing protein [Clostridia bacterium]|nr:DUF4037 domain-containing protein [Clostridia bacterium]